jgi:O-antigen/teichoic acid export membrane protein
MGRVGRAGWSVADQAISSLTNFALAVIAARLLDAEDFGGFAAALAVYFFAASLARATCGELLIIRHSAGKASEHARAALGGALGIGLLSSACAFGGWLLVDGSFGDALGALVLVLPGLLLQDTLRYLFVADGRPSAAFANDAVWAVAQLVFVGAIVIADEVSTSTIVLTWGLAGALAAVVGLVQARSWPDLAAGPEWFRSNRGLWPRYLAEFFATMGAWQVMVFAVGGIAGLTAVGALRAAQVLYGPLHFVFYGARLAVIPEGVRDHARGESVFFRQALLVGAAVVGLSLAWTAVIVALPDSIGEALLGDSWTDATDVRLTFGLYMVSQAVIVGALVGLRIVVAAASSMGAALISAAAIIVVPALAATTGDLTTIGWGVALGGAIGAAAWWWQLVRLRSPSLAT